MMETKITVNGIPVSQTYAEEKGIAKRFNSGKVNWSLMPVDAMEAELRVWEYGRKKYPRTDRNPENGMEFGNWELLWGDETVGLSLACAMRHIAAMMKGEMIDGESGQPHAAHVRCNMAPIIRWLNEKK